MEQHIIYGALAFFAGVVLYIVIEKRLQGFIRMPLRMGLLFEWALRGPF